MFTYKFSNLNSFYAARLFWVLLCALLGVLLFSFSAHASKRVALVIGNSAYQNAGELMNPTNDATDMADALNELGFTVVKGIDLDSRGMREKVREFTNALRGAETAMLYYAGHAMQVNGQNYLAPVDTRLEYESDLDFETIPLKFIQAQMEREAKTSLIFLDACRDNPLTRSLKTSTRSQGISRGLAKEDLASAGILIAFATNPENVAWDGKGRNSPFTKAMLDNIKRPGVEISSLMTDVRVQVVEKTKGKQTPWINSALLGRFYFNEEKPKPKEIAKTAEVKEIVKPEASPVVQPLVRSTVGVDNAQIASLAYDTVKDSTDIEELEVFVSLYSDTFYGKLAKIKISKLKKSQMVDEAPKVAEPKIVEVPTPKKEEPKATETIVVETKVEEVKVEVAVLTPEKEVKPALEAEAVKSRSLKLGVQKELVRLNCGPGRPDGVWGKKSQAALDRFSKKLKLVSAKPSEELFEQLKDHEGSGCPRIVKTCSAGQKLSSKGHCYKPKAKVAKAHVAKACRSGYRRNSKGKCYKPHVRKAKRCRSGYRLSSKGKCYKPRAKKRYVKKRYAPKRHTRKNYGYSSY